MVQVKFPWVAHPAHLVYITVINSAWPDNGKPLIQSTNTQCRHNHKKVRKKNQSLLVQLCAKKEKRGENQQQHLAIILRNLNTNNAFSTEPAAGCMHSKAQWSSPFSPRHYGPKARLSVSERIRLRLTLKKILNTWSLKLMSSMPHTQAQFDCWSLEMHDSYSVFRTLEITRITER